MDKRFVLDNSILMSWCFEYEASPYSDAVLDALERAHAIVPSIWPLELANVLLVAERKRRLSKADTSRFILLVQSLPIRVEPEGPSRVLGDILALARETLLSREEKILASDIRQMRERIVQELSREARPVLKIRRVHWGSHWV